MPTIELKLNRLEKLVGKKLDIDQLQYDLQWISLDVEEVNKTDNIIKVEYNPNRPDFASPEGIARTLQGYYELKTGIAPFQIIEGTEIMHVSTKVRKVRPYVVCGIVRDIHLDEDQVRTLMNIQEDLHWAIGRDRRKVAIGIHDYDKVKGPYQYTTVKPDGVRFRPLHLDAYEMTPAEILQEHPMGIQYKHLLDGFDEYPIIYDAKGKVVSFPPIINGVYTTVTNWTKNLLLDLTGTSFDAVNYALNIIATTFADMGSKLENMTVIYEDEADKPFRTPNLSPKTWQVHVDYINSYIGLNLKPDEMIKCFEKVRLGARKTKNKNVLEVDVPAYRLDFMHEVDFTEEVAMGYGYKNLPITVREGGVGSYHPQDQLLDLSRKIMIGCGALEMVNSTLASKQDYERLKLPFNEKDNVIIANPVSEEYNTVRAWLLTGLMKNLMVNRSGEKPFRLFEVGDVILLDEKEDTKAYREPHIAVIIHSDNADYTEIKSILDHYLRTLGVLGQVKIKATSFPFYILGRSGEILFNGTKIGTIGEMHPEVVKNFELDYPTAAFELNISPFIKWNEIK